MDQAKPKLEYVTLAKGMAILMVVFWHALVPPIRQSHETVLLVWNLGITVWVGVFMALAGLLFERNLPKYRAGGGGRFLRNKFKTLMIPYFTLSLVAYAVIGLCLKVPFTAAILAQGGYAGRSAGGMVFEILTNQGHIDKHLWFCYTLFLIFALTWALPAFWKKPAGLALLTAAGLATPVGTLPELADLTLRYMVFFNLGRNPALVDRLASPKGLGCAAALLAVAGAAWAGWPGWPDPPYPAANAVVLVKGLAGAAMVIGLAKRLEGRRGRRPLLAAGEYSYDMYLGHQPFLTSGTAGALLAATDWPPLAVAAAAFAVGLSGSVLASRLVLRKVNFLRKAVLGDWHG
jgi:peptidoglycan/LPS O-acetylase OafA/YrhL